MSQAPIPPVGVTRLAKNMLESLQLLQIVVGGLMIIGIGVLLFFNYRWRDQSGELPPDKIAKMRRSITLLIVFLVIPNVILILLTRGLS